MAHTPCLAVLNERLAQAAERMEHPPLLARLASPDLTLAEYVIALRGLYAFHIALEPAITACVRHMPAALALLDDRRVLALREDLALFGTAPPLEPAAVPLLASVPAALGALYTIEAHGMAGRVVARGSVASLGLLPEQGASFLAGLTAGAARVRWTRLLAMLTPLREADHARVADAACACFLSLEERTRPARRVTTVPLPGMMAEGV